MNANLASFLYLVSGILFILALRGLSHPTTSRQGNTYGMIGMAIAIVTTLALATPSIGSFLIILVGLAIGGSGRPVLLLEHFEHPARDEEAAEDVHRRQRDGQDAHRAAGPGFGVRRRQHGSDDHDGRNGVGDRHQRRVQRRRHRPHDVVADVDREHEDDQVGDGVRDFHVRFS